jgi:hypothetical protein
MDMLQKAIFIVGLTLVILLIPFSFGFTTQAAYQEATPTLAPIPDPVLGEFDPAAVAEIDLADYPLIPETLSQQAITIYREGLESGNNPHTFIKVGDCMTDTPFFLIPIGEGDYDLGEYESLQPVIDQFIDGELNSFSRQSQAAAGGFNTASILDSMWANPEFCESGETPLSCEFRIMQPSIALVMFGTNDVTSLTEEQFDFSLRSVLAETIRNHTLPILSTFPQRPEFPEKTLLFNQIIVQAALDYDIPLINLWQALDPLPNQGVEPDDTTHMTEPIDGSAANFTAENLQTGFTTRNLLTLQVLDLVLNSEEQ